MKAAGFVPVRDLEPVGSPDATGFSEWRSTGNDPGFLIALSFARARYLLIELDGRDALLDAQLYISYGAGFRERDTITPEPAESHLFIVDVGRVGAVRALRVDPATIPTRYACRVSSSNDPGDVDRRVRERLAASSGLNVHRVGDLNRLLRIGSNLVPRLRAPRVARHASRLHALAASETVDVRADNGAPWLSLVVPVYDTPPRYLNDLLGSFRKQDIAGVELVISDDASRSSRTRKWLAAHASESDIKLVRNLKNAGIAAAINAGLAETRGDWIAFLDHDDLIAPHALKLVRKALEANPEAEFLYTDELVVDDRLRAKGYMLKPAYDPVLLTGVNYINHFSVFRRQRLEEIGFLRPGYDGSQDYDLLLRYLRSVEEKNVLHLPYPAYWWRRNGKTYSRRFIDKATANARLALADHVRTIGVEATVAPALTETLHRLDFAIGRHPPRVSIIIPNKNAFFLIERVLKDVFERTDYPAFEVIVVDNGSDDRAVLELYDSYRRSHPNFRAEVRPEPFNFARAVNRGLSLATGKHFLLLNNDIEVIHPDWLAEMVSCLRHADAGIVGAKLLYPNGTLQHAGVIAGFGGLAGHWYLNKPANYGGPLNRFHVRSSMTCVTAAVMLIAGECRQAVGEFDAVDFAVAYNDVDYCLRAHRLGFRIIWTPFARLYHHESATRGPEKSSAASRQRFEAEKANLRRIHDTTDFLDPAASPLNGRNHSTPKLRRVERLPSARTWR